MFSLFGPQFVPKVKELQLKLGSVSVKSGEEAIALKKPAIGRTLYDGIVHR
jgi:hypothetical protein